MNKKILQTIIYIVVDVIIFAYMICVMTGIIQWRSERQDVCSSVNINVEQNITDSFFSSDDVSGILSSNRLYPLHQPLQKVNTRDIESLLEKNLIIDKAECYITSSGSVNIDIKQRTAIFHVMSNDSKNYYLDNTGKCIYDMQYTIDAIIATGNINHTYAVGPLKKLGNIIASNAFWNNQIEQVHILQNGAVELIPRIGNHIIYLGQPTDIENKLARVLKFYHYGLNKIGWNKYSRISVEHHNQIICDRSPIHHTPTSVENINNKEENKNTQ